MVMTDDRHATGAADHFDPTDPDQLIAGLRSGRDDAATYFVTTYAPRMIATARRVLNDEHEACDAVQDSFMSAFRSIETFDGRAQLGTWLHRIVVNASLARLRKAHHRHERRMDDLLPQFDKSGYRITPASTWELGAESGVDVEERRQAVRHAIDALPPDAREIIILRDVLELDTATTAEQLGLSEPAVKTRLHRARHALRALLEERFAA